MLVAPITVYRLRKEVKIVLAARQRFYSSGLWDIAGDLFPGTKL